MAVVVVVIVAVVLPAVVVGGCFISLVVGIPPARLLPANPPFGGKNGEACVVYWGCGDWVWVAYGMWFNDGA